MTQNHIPITYNGNSITVAHGITLAEFIAHMRLVPPFAVAVNCEFVPRSAYDSTIIKVNDAVEIVVPMQGG